MSLFHKRDERASRVELRERRLGEQYLVCHSRSPSTAPPITSIVDAPATARNTSSTYPMADNRPRSSELHREALWREFMGYPDERGTKQ